MSHLRPDETTGNEPLRFVPGVALRDGELANEAARTLIANARRAYWRFNVRLIAALLGVGALVSFGIPLIAESLEHIRFAGWSLPFYVGAQGATIVYLALVGIYIGAMTWADRRLRSAVEQARQA